MEVMVVGFGVRGKGLCFKEPFGDLRCRASAIFSMAHIAFDIDINPGMKKEGEAGCISCISLRLAFITSSHIPLANHKSQSNFKKGWKFWSNHFPKLLLLGPSLRCRVSQNSETRMFFLCILPVHPQRDLTYSWYFDSYPSFWFPLHLECPFSFCPSGTNGISFFEIISEYPLAPPQLFFTCSYKTQIWWLYIQSFVRYSYCVYQFSFFVDESSWRARKTSHVF